MGRAGVTARSVILLLLTCVASTVDVVSYVALGHVFTANMTGNTVLLGLAIGQIERQAITRSTFALVGFIIGACLGGRIAETTAGNRPSMRRFARALVIELLALAGVLASWQLSGGLLADGWLRLSLIGLTAAAMGLQSAAVHVLSVPGVATTYITGTLTAFCTALVRRGRRTAAATAEAQTGTRLLFGVWLVYAVSAASAAGIIQVIQGWLLVVPLVLLLLVIGMAWWHGE